MNSLDWLEKAESGPIGVQYAQPQYSRGEVDAAGDVLIAPPDIFLEGGDVDEAAYAHWEQALAVINNWRSSHSFPLNTFQVTLKQRAQRIDPDPLVAQRIKRLPAIEDKLKRFKNRGLKLSEVQDIGGCRAVLTSVEHVDRLVSMYKESVFKQKLDHEDDYIRSPKSSGYRGVHLIYRYYSDRKETYNGLKIEAQFRSRFQHYWATAVETVDTFTHQALKTGRGKKKWRRFFELMSTEIAHKEGTPGVPHTPGDRGQLIAELRRYAGELNAVNHLKLFGTAVRYYNEPGIEDAHYFLIKLEPEQGRVILRGFKFNEPSTAADAYEETERSLNRNAGEDAVLVSVDSMASLTKAYPNYFADTTAFVQLLEQAVS